MKRFEGRRVSIRARDYLVYLTLIPALTSAIKQALDSAAASERSIVLDIGCGQRPYEHLFSPARYIGLNYGAEAAAPDIVGDAQQLPILPDCVDIVFSTQVIEHVPKPHAMLAEAYRVLKPGGRLVLSGPFYWPLHEEPHDYFRFTLHGLQYMLEHSGFVDIHIAADTASLTQVAVSIIEVLPKRLSWLVPLINLTVPPLQKLSRDHRSTLNYVVQAKKP